MNHNVPTIPYRGLHSAWLTIRITPEMMEKVAAMAQEQGRSTAGMVRMLMRYGIEWVEREGKSKEAGR